MEYDTWIVLRGSSDDAVTGEERLQEDALRGLRRSPNPFGNRLVARIETDERFERRLLQFVEVLDVELEQPAAGGDRPVVDIPAATDN